MNNDFHNTQSFKPRGKRVGHVRAAALYACAVLLVSTGIPATFCQSNPRLQAFFEQSAGLSQEQIDQIRHGIPVVKIFPPRDQAEVFLFGAVYIHAAPESYLRLVSDVNRMRKIPGYVEFGVFENPPMLSDLDGLSLDSDDIRALRICRPGVCEIQLPGASMRELQQSVDWSAPDVDERVNRFVRRKALDLLMAYQKEGNHALGVYEDKPEAAPVAQEFAYMLSYSKALPADLPEFYSYLLAYPDAKSGHIEDRFYWTKVKFGLKPTLRIIHQVIMQGNAADDVIYAVAEKQLYSSHYFDTALDLSFCIRDRAAASPQGFYLVMAMGTEQQSLTGLKGEVIRKFAVGRSASNLEAALTNIRNLLEANTKQ
jgi:hypothetical protein